MRFFNLLCEKIIQSEELPNSAGGKMIKQGLKNFISALKYVFTPLGCLFLGAVLGASVAVPVISSAITTLADGVNKLLENAAVDINALIDSLADSVYALDWNEPANAVSTLLNREWLTDTFTSNINAFSAETAAHAEETGVLVAGAVDSVVGAFGAVAAFAFVGLTVGSSSKRERRRRSAGRNALISVRTTCASSRPTCAGGSSNSAAPSASAPKLPRP